MPPREIKKDEWDENEPQMEQKRGTPRDLCIQTKPATKPVKKIAPEPVKEEKPAQSKRPKREKRPPGKTVRNVIFVFKGWLQEKLQ